MLGRKIVNGVTGDCLILQELVPYLIWVVIRKLESRIGAHGSKVFILNAP